MGVFNFGERQSVENWNRGVQASADGFPKAKPGGAEFKWSSVTALSKDTYLTDQLDDQNDPQGVDTENTITFANSKALSDAQPVPAGYKVLRYGTPIVRDTDGKFILAVSGTYAQGDVFIVNETVVYNPSATVQNDPRSLYPIAIDGGRIFLTRLVHSANQYIGKDVDDGSVDSGVTITLAQLQAALPNLSYARD